MRTERFFIPWEPPSFNLVWAGMHWRSRKRIADAGHKACLVARQIRPFWRPVTISFQPVAGAKKRRYDCCNYAVGNKVIVDGLVKLGVLGGDWIDNLKETRTLLPTRGKESGVWVTIEEWEAAADEG